MLASSPIPLGCGSFLDVREAPGDAYDARPGVGPPVAACGVVLGLPEQPVAVLAPDLGLVELVHRSSPSLALSSMPPVKTRMRAGTSGEGRIFSVSLWSKKTFAGSVTKILSGLELRRYTEAVMN